MAFFISEVLSFKLTADWWKLEGDKRRNALAGLESIIERFSARRSVLKAAAYSSLRHDSDLIFWIMSDTPEEALEFKADVVRQLGMHANSSYGFISVYESKGKNKDPDGNRYFVAYPMSKDPEWYLLDEGAQKDIIAEHVKMAVGSKTNNGIVSYTTNAFGIGDNEFVVIYELPSIPEWVMTTKELRRAKARKWIRNEMPILVGIADGLKNFV